MTQRTIDQACSYGEPGHQEIEVSRYLADRLGENGCTVQENIAGISMRSSSTCPGCGSRQHAQTEWFPQCLGEFITRDAIRADSIDTAANIAESSRCNSCTAPMHIDQQDSIIVERLRRTFSNLVAVYRFGSTAQGTASETSDADVGVLARERIDPVRRFDVQEALAAHIGRDVH